MEASPSGSNAAPPRRRWYRAADLGCGTGLMGPLLRPHVSGRLEGVDLSQGMVDKARAKGCYDHLAVEELVAYLDGSAGQEGVQCGGSGGYDLLVAADVFVYIGDLGPVFASGARHSGKG